MATRKSSAAGPTPEAVSAAEGVKTITHRAKRKNIPPAGLEAQGRVEEAPTVRFEYNPHLPPVLHIHERVSTQAMLRVLAREDVYRDLFADPQQSYAEAVQFYKHDMDWANRVILGESLAVMASLARREDLAARVQMIYIDPPNISCHKSHVRPLPAHWNTRDFELDLCGQLSQWAKATSIARTWAAT